MDREPDVVGRDASFELVNDSLAGAIEAISRAEALTRLLARAIEDYGEIDGPEIFRAALAEHSIAFDVDAAVDRLLIGSPTFLGVEDHSRLGVPLSRSGQLQSPTGEDSTYIIDRYTEEGWQRLLEWPVQEAVRRADPIPHEDWGSVAEDVARMSGEALEALRLIPVESCDALEPGFIESGPWAYDGLCHVQHVGGSHELLAELAETILGASAEPASEDVGPSLELATQWMPLLVDRSDIERVGRLVTAGIETPNAYELLTLRIPGFTELATDEILRDLGLT